MKRVILIMATAFALSACGGGGGGAAPSVNLDSPPPEETRRLTPAEQAEVRTAANRLRSDLDSLENNAEANSLRQEIDALIADINAARHTIEELQNEIANLRSEINTLKVAETQTESPPPNCGANEEIIGGSCECISGYVRKNNICEPESPPPNCGANEKISGQNCVCADGYRLNAKGACICIDSSRRNNFGICEMIPPNCGTNEMADGQNCVCVDGYQRNNSGMCEMIPPTCGANEEIIGGSCECISGYVRQNEICELPPPNPEFYTAEYQESRTLLHTNPIPAYEAGAFGQGVTVIVLEGRYRPTHEDLAANVITTDTTLANVSERYEYLLGTTSFFTAHGTGVAGILGAVRGNGKGAHGIAPSVKMWLTGNSNVRNPLQHIPFAIENSIAIVNRSHFIGIENRLYTSFDTEEEAKNHFAIPPEARKYADIIGNADYVEVAAAGNIVSFAPTNRVQAYGYFPIIAPELEDNILMVVAINRNDNILGSSKHCQLAARWCLAAYGGGDTPPAGVGSDPDKRDSRYWSYFAQTSAATPVVSGALALLKSFRPELKMTVIRQVLLESARPLGTRKNDGMPDEVFGWGAVDVGNGIATLQAMQTADGMAYSDLRKSLPSEFSHLRGRMESVSVAIRITDRSFYNMRLSDIVGGDSDSHSASLGNAAKEMQADDSLSPENAGFGFNYANGDYDLHYAGGNENEFRFSGGLRHDDSQSSYIGEGGGIFSAANASDTGGYVKWTTKNYGGISAFGEYGRTQIKADYDSNSFVSKIQNARAEEWTAGFQYQNLFLHNDNLQFSARQESRISGGEMILHYPVADGDSHKAFIGESPQTIRTETAKIPIKQKPQTIYTAGYSQKTENSKWSAAAEWNAATNAKGVSFAIELQIR